MLILKARIFSTLEKLEQHNLLKPLSIHWGVYVKNIFVTESLLYLS